MEEEDESLYLFSAIYNTGKCNRKQKKKGKKIEDLTPHCDINASSWAIHGKALALTCNRETEKETQRKKERKWRGQCSQKAMENEVYV